MQEFCTCFRKQFCFQNGKGGNRAGKYFTAFNQERGLKNDRWGMMCFIHLAALYGFTDNQILDELKIRGSMYAILKYKTANIVTKGCEDKQLEKTILNKIALVKNSVKIEFRVVIEN